MSPVMSLIFDSDTALHGPGPTETGLLKLELDFGLDGEGTDVDDVDAFLCPLLHATSETSETNVTSTPAAAASGLEIEQRIESNGETGTVRDPLGRQQHA